MRKLMFWARNCSKPFAPSTRPLFSSFNRPFSQFREKPEQILRVLEYVRSKHLIPDKIVAEEVSAFYDNLGIDDMYFQSETEEKIGDHVLALYGSKIQAATKDSEVPVINLKRQTESGAVYIHSDFVRGSPHSKNYELGIDDTYLDIPIDETPFRIESYLSTGEIMGAGTLRSYLVRRCEFVKPDPTPEEKFNINLVSDTNFILRTTKKTREMYQQIMESVLDDATLGPIIKVKDLPDNTTKRLIIAFRRRSTKKFFSALSDSFNYHGLFTTRKFIDQFSNGVTVCSFYLKQIEGFSGSFEKCIQGVIDESTLLYCLPQYSLTNFVQSKQLSVTEAVYGTVGWVFAQHFLKRLGSEYQGLSNIVDMKNLAHVEVLSNIKKKLRADTFTREYILDIIKLYPELVKLLYRHFAGLHCNRIQYEEIPVEEVLKQIKKTVQNSNEFKVFESFLTFNNQILKTNFFRQTKVALSFRLDPKFLSEMEFPHPLYGLFLVVGSGFRGFHLRFRDIARGGIRMIKSRNKENYTINLRNLLDENYGLAATQQRKNKDIPEGGSKGTILLDVDNKSPRVAFEKYVDSILDLVLLNERFQIKDRYGSEEILFFGPDEGTAEMMDWASKHARVRGARTWNAFTTGKSQTIGGIPHDIYGMTTRSVHQYVLGIYRKLGLKEEEVTKLQTGGPDGDLGSNEILISKDKTIGVVDGSGVLYDPNGIDREALHLLAKNRKMVCEFDKSKLSPGGFFVSVDQDDVQLPDGRVIASGVDFRNHFHLDPLSNADVFVPCGGRPESVNLRNVQQMFKPDGTPRFKYIVEGANLFITQDARVVLEKAGVVLFKDASANKGGVTSSSLEVLAALSLDDTEFPKYMQVKPNFNPEFYNSYVKNVQNTVEKNAALEFEALWRESKKSGRTISEISDDLSKTIVELREEIQKSSLWDNIALRKAVLDEALPPLLLEKVGLDKLLERIPLAYLQAIFGSYLASRFVYHHGTNPSQFAFFEFMAPYFEKASKNKIE